MSNEQNTLILETAADLIDYMPATKMRERLISAVERSDLEEVYELNKAIIEALRLGIATKE